LERLAAIKTFSVALESSLLFDDDAAAEVLALFEADDVPVEDEDEDPHPHKSIPVIAAQSNTAISFFFIKYPPKFK